MLIFIIVIQLSTLIYIWKYESEILIEKERKSLEYKLNVHSERLESEMNRLQKELEFLSILEVMDDIVVNDIDKRIKILLNKKARDLSKGIIIQAFNQNICIASSKHNNIKLKEFLEFNLPIYASFDRKKKIGHVSLLYPLKNFTKLSTDNPYQNLWLKAPKNFNIKPLNHNNRNNIIVSSLLKGKLDNWRLFLSYKKKYALESIQEVEKILLFAFILSLFLLLFVVWILSKRQIRILENTQEILALKRTFLSTISHELRTPLGSILNLIQHLMVSPKMGDNEIEMLVRIENSSQHLLEMINNLLQLSKLESKSMPVTIEEININLVIKEIIEIVEPLIDDKELIFKKTLLQEDLTIKTDLNIFKQIIINLLSNAIKFTEHGKIEVTLIQKDTIFIFEVIDTGIGISKEKQSSLFSEFYQAHTKEIKHSSGLGLALSQKMAKLIKGDITIQSKGVGFGVRARFTFKPEFDGIL